MGTSVFCKTDRLPIQSQQDLIFHSVMWVLVYQFCKGICYHCWVQRLGIILALLLTVLAFLTIVDEGRGLEMQPSLCSTVQTMSTRNNYHNFLVFFPQLSL